MASYLALATGVLAATPFFLLLSLYEDTTTDSFQEGLLLQDGKGMDEGVRCRISCRPSFMTSCVDRYWKRVVEFCIQRCLRFCSLFPALQKRGSE